MRPPVFIIFVVVVVVILIIAFTGCSNGESYKNAQKRENMEHKALLEHLNQRKAMEHMGRMHEPFAVPIY